MVDRRAGAEAGWEQAPGCLSTKPVRWYRSATALLCITRQLEATGMPTWWEAPEEEDSSSPAGAAFSRGLRRTPGRAEAVFSQVAARAERGMPQSAAPAGTAAA